MYYNNRVISNSHTSKIPVAIEQLEHEMKHLVNKLKVRDYERYVKYKNLNDIQIHPPFCFKEGYIESWKS
jgi:hypothetical protein